MKIFRTEQIRSIDELTIKNEPVSPADLMERAAGQVYRWYVRNFDRTRRVLVFAGPGNNGGDGLVIARLLSSGNFSTELFYVNVSSKKSDEWQLNFQRLESQTSVLFNSIDNIDQFPFIGSDDVVIDALFGSGLTRPVEGLASQVIKKINNTEAVVVSVDIPSGLFGEDNSHNDPESIIRADYTITFEFPKLSFLFAENAKYTGEWIVVPIGLNNVAINSISTPFSMIEENYISSLLRKRQKFDHKGVYGHALLIAGSYGRMGAAVLAAGAALRCGAGLVTCNVPGCGYNIIQSSVPEAMTVTDSNEMFITETVCTDPYDAIGLGPGIGNDELTQKVVQSMLLQRTKPLVIDADGINILGMNKKWLPAMPALSVLTPHIKEFERLAGESGNSYERLEKQIKFSATFNVIVVLKGAYTSVSLPDGRVFFNNTGNPGMATAGSGDVLTGMILSLLAQSYTPENASVTAVYLHGMAGDIAAAKSGCESVIATDIICNIGGAFLKLRSNIGI
ncbi:MAG: NAD(P)H-hydrate dehydratase [Bacteroidales bacterium]|jgi:NAD(P)H-hydrate epimerase|nr:NAD(P)H-hydrate dehydratase [Bacteroidales bacterium]